jgi:hypothetical protein
MKIRQLQVLLLLMQACLSCCFWASDTNNFEKDSFDVDYLKDIFFKNLLEDYSDVQEKNVNENDEIEIGHKVDAFLVAAQRTTANEDNLIRRKRQLGDLDGAGE